MGSVVLFLEESVEALPQISQIPTIAVHMSVQLHDSAKVHCKLKKPLQSRGVCSTNLLLDTSTKGIKQVYTSTQEI
jgi:hypothetical protein